MSGDIYFESNIQRTISVDIRYTLFIIDKYANAGHLIDEMKVVKTRIKSNDIEQPEKEIIRTQHYNEEGKEKKRLKKLDNEEPYEDPIIKRNN